MHQFAGEEGFRWFIGKVEDVTDEHKIGRVRVRVFNVHADDVAVSPVAFAKLIVSVFAVLLTLTTLLIVQKQQCQM